MRSPAVFVAARELRQSGAPIVDIAAGVGYESEAAFNRAFKREFGTPPAARGTPSGSVTPEPPISLGMSFLSTLSGRAERRAPTNHMLFSLLRRSVGL